MALSRKRQRELKRLKRDAERLWDEQREAIDHATVVLKDARRQAANYAREEIRPRIDEGFGSARRAVGSARESFVSDVLPAISGTIGSALAVLEAAKNPQVREVVRRVSSAGQKAGVVTMPKKSGGPGKYILIGLGVVAFAGVAYAAWQTLRADDDLWIEDLGDPGSADIGDDDEF